MTLTEEECRLSERLEGQNRDPKYQILSCSGWSKEYCWHCEFFDNCSVTGKLDLEIDARLGLSSEKVVYT